MQETIFGRALTRLGVATASPGAFVVLLVYVALWPIFDPKSFDWHGFATVLTWAMTLMIQRSEHRDTQAIHAKLDELLRAHGETDEGLQTIDEREPEEIERRRERATRGKPGK